MTHTEWAEETLKRLPVLVEKSRRVKLFVIGTPDGGVVVDDVIQAEYNGLIALLADGQMAGKMQKHTPLGITWPPISNPSLAVTFRSSGIVKTEFIRKFSFRHAIM